jgi:hypothetical protein
MFKRTAIVISLCLPLFAWAADPDAKRGPKSGDKPAAATSAAAGKGEHKKVDHSAEMQRNRSRGATMGACTKQAADQKLTGIERKQFLATCMKPQ